MNELPEEYLQWINNIKDKIQSAQIKAAISVNSQLIALYWELGKMIAEKQEKNGWGTGLINKMAVDLKRGLTNTHGFSRSNLYNIRQFYLFYRNNSFVHQAGGLLKMDMTLSKTQIKWKAMKISTKLVDILRFLKFYYRYPGDITYLLSISLSRLMKRFSM